MVFLQLIVLSGFLLSSFFAYGSCDEESNVQGDGLEVVRSFVASADFEKYRRRVQQGTVFVPSAQKEQKRSVKLWQGVIRNVFKEKEQQDHSEEKQADKLGFVEYGVGLDIHEKDINLQGSDLSFLNGKNLVQHEAVTSSQKVASKVACQAGAISSVKKASKEKEKLDQKVKDAADHEFLDEQLRIVKKQEEQIRERILEDSAQEFNRKIKKSVVKASSASIRQQKLLKVYEAGGSLLIEFAKAYKGRDSNELITSPGFNKAVDKYLSDMEVPKDQRGMIKGQLMNSLSEK